MNPGYFHRVARETPTRVWVNNPSGPEITKALEAGAVACTTNPSYCAKLLLQEADFLERVIDRVIAYEPDNNAAAERVYQIAAQRILDSFLPLYEQTAGVQGYVTIQSDPRREHSATAIVDEALRCQKLGPNFMAKVPVTRAGIEAMRVLIGHNVPICATEIFSLSQAVRMCAAYEAAAEHSGRRPVFYVTHITGIFDQLFETTVRNERIAIAPEALEQAGTLIARKEYHTLKARGYAGTLLGGGARSLHHFTGMVGGDLAVTLNWSTMEQLVAQDAPVVPCMDLEAPPGIVQELCDKLPNFLRAYEEDALSVDEYEDFGPVVFFRTMFLNGYSRLLDAIADRRLRRARSA
jgi:transaldolase